MNDYCTDEMNRENQKIKPNNKEAEKIKTSKNDQLTRSLPHIIYSTIVHVYLVFVRSSSYKSTLRDERNYHTKTQLHNY